MWAIKSAIAGIVSRNLSHNIWNTVVQQIENKQGYDEFLTYLWMEKMEKIDFKQVFENDLERVKNHHLLDEYVQLRKGWKSVLESLKAIDRSKIVLWNSIQETSSLPSNNDIINWSRCGSTEFCNGRLNTILGILYLIEGEEYVKNNVEIVDVMRDVLEEIMQQTPWFSRDETWIKEYLFYEDPHDILLVEGKQIDPNTMFLSSIMWGKKLEHKVVPLKWEHLGEVSYILQYIMYLNTRLSDKEKRENKYWFIDLVETTFNSVNWGSEMLLKFLLFYKESSESKKLLNHMLKIHPELEQRLWVMYDKFTSWDIDKEEFEFFIKKKYGEQFGLDDIIRVYS